MNLLPTAGGGRLGRRIVLQFLLAATVPLTVLGLLAHSALVSQADQQAQRQLDLEVGNEAMQVFNRLVAARAALELLSAAAGPSASVNVDRADGHVFKAVARVAPTDYTDLAQAWASAGASAAEPPGALLRWRPAVGEASARIWLSLPPAADGTRWIGELGSSYLWADTFDAVEANRACVSDAAGQALYCTSNLPVLPAAEAPNSASGPFIHSSKSLFLGKEFGTGDWQFRARQNPGTTTAQALPLGSMALKVMAAVLLLVVTLSLVQVRRTMEPLRMLVAVTRRLARQDYSARVAITGDDEFRALGDAFNDMAARMDSHVRELQLLSSIDRDILESPDVDRLAARVLGHLATLQPDATVALCIEDLADGTRPRTVSTHLRRAGGAPSFQRTSTLQPVAWDSLGQDGPHSAWLESASDDQTGLCAALGLAPGSVYRAVGCAQGQTQAVLWVSAPHAAGEPAEPGWTQRVDELRDRLAVALSAAAHDQQLVHQATHDSLTGLLNRAGLQAALAGALQRGQRFALLFVDLDRFKHVNDSLGHHAGDQLLGVAADRMRQALPPSACLARPGGDEFVVLIEATDTAPLPDPGALGRVICEQLAQSFPIAGRSLVVGASVGWCLHPDDGRSADELMRHADLAMYAAKRQGRGQALRFDASIGEAVAEQAWLYNDLRLAVQRGELLLHYQPRVDSGDEIARAAEALVRWQHPTHGLVSPMLFIPAAEETGVIHELGLWVLREACRQLAQWRRDGVPIDRISVNLSALQLADPGLYDHVTAALEDHGVAPQHLELEVTESLLVGDQTVAAAVLGRLRALGVAVALDDFGTGYSSMAYLSRMPVDVIKVDRAFVKDLGKDRLADTVTRAIVTLAHSLDLHLVAEGVETREQAALLKAMGCQQLQGYLFSKPLPPEAFLRLQCLAWDHKATKAASAAEAINAR